MNTEVNRQVQLEARPNGFPKDTDFRVVEAEIPRPGEDQMLCRTIYLSLDPYMRGLMNAGASYAAGLEIGDVMPGRARLIHVRYLQVGVRDGYALP